MKDNVVKRRQQRAVIVLVFIATQLLAMTNTWAQKKRLFAVNSPGSYPYLYFDEGTQQYRGIVKDFFVEIEKSTDLTVQFVDSNQLRSEQFVISGKYDFYLANTEWLKQPEKIIFTKPLVEHFTYLYSLTPFEQNHELSSIKGKRVCARENFIYTGISDYFENGSVERIDASSQRLMASMLLAGRCEFAILNNYNAFEAFSHPESCHARIYQSPQPTSKVSLMIIMRPQLESIRIKLNQELDAFARSGKLQTALDHHVFALTFPKNNNC